MKIVVMFLGRSLEGIYGDARDAGLVQDTELVVVARDGDQLQPPAEIADRVVSVSAFTVIPGAEYVLISNGGTSAQLVPVLIKLVHAGVALKVFDLQRDGAVRLA